MTEGSPMVIKIQPIGFVQTDAVKVSRHWTLSDIEGLLVVNKKYVDGMKDIKKGHRIVVIFYFHKSPPFTRSHLVQQPPHLRKGMGVFSICSPIRPNPIGMSILEVVDVSENAIHVKGLDMINETPIIDIKPFVKEKRVGILSY
jgi:tRNA-Thr(GGU) m(6)t(6)A37 methyltransferase TsaA